MYSPDDALIVRKNIYRERIYYITKNNNISK